MRSIVICLAFVITSLMAGCAGMALNQGKIVSDQVSKTYIKDTFGVVTYTNLYFSIPWDFNDAIRAYKEGLLSDNSLSEKQKQEKFDEVTKDFGFVENGYLIYFFRLESPALFKAGEFSFTFNDQSGNAMIKKTVPMSNKVTVTSKYGSSISYNYLWMMQLNKPFTRENFPSGKYNVTITYPNGEKLVYELTL